MSFISNHNSNQAAPAYGAASQLPPPPPPPFQSTPSDSYGDLVALDSSSSMYGGGPSGHGDYTPGYNSPSYADTPSYGSPLKPQQQHQPNLDLTKFRTKLCRHFVMGHQCPFEERCAFAHGYEEQAAGRAAAPRPPAYDFLASAPVSSGASSDVDSAENHAAAANGPFPSSPTAAREDAGVSTPPAYPTKYRHDPYNVHTAMVFAQ